MIMIINRVTFAKSGLDVMHQLTLAIASAHVSLRRRHSKIAKGKTPQIQTSGIDSAHVLSPRLMIPHARSHSTTPRPAPNNRTNVSSRCPSARTRGPERAAPRRTRLAGPSNPIHHATLPQFLSWPISPPAPAPLLQSITSSTPQPQSAKPPAEPRVRASSISSAARISSSKEQQVTVLDGSVPEGGEAAGGDPARPQRDPHHRAGEASQLHHLRARLAPGQPPRRFLARFFGTRSVEAFLTVEKKTIPIWRGFPHPNCLLRV
jgi:hypothetical protein